MLGQHSGRDNLSKEVVLKEGSRVGGADFLSAMTSDRTQGKGMNLSGGSGWTLGKGSLVKRVVGHWNRLPKEVLIPPNPSKSIWMMLLAIYFNFR